MGNVKSRVDPMVARSNALGHVVSAIPPPKPSVSETTNSRDNSKIEPSFGDHLSEMNKLRDEISMLKKVTSQKDRVILEKDKKINEYNAEKWDKDKLQKVKLGQIQKDHEIQVNKLRMENGNLRKECMMLKKKKERYEARSDRKIKLSTHKIETPRSPAGERSGNDSSSEFSKNVSVKKDLSNELDEEAKGDASEEEKKEETKVEGESVPEKEEEDEENEKDEEKNR